MVCGCSAPGIAASIPVEGLGVHLLRLLCSYRALRPADHSFGGVLPRARVCVCVCVCVCMYVNWAVAPRIVLYVCMCIYNYKFKYDVNRTSDTDGQMNDTCKQWFQNFKEETFLKFQRGRLDIT